MGRRGENIRYRKCDKRWESRAVNGEPVNGRTSYKYFYGRTYKEARQKKLDFEKIREAEPENGAVPDMSENGAMPDVSKKTAVTDVPESTDVPDITDIRTDQTEEMETDMENVKTFAEVSEEWLLYKKMSVKESSAATYAFLIEKHILPKLGGLTLGEITQEKLREFLNGQKKDGGLKKGTGLSDKTVSDLKALVVQILSYAFSQGMMDAVPACPPVSCRQKGVNVLNSQEQEKLELQAVREDTPFVIGVMIALYAGLRVGEICGLKWENIDFEDQTINVDFTVSRIRDISDGAGSRTKVVIGSPKTDSSKRSIPIRNDLLEYLAARQREDELYVVTGTGKCMEPRVFLDRFKRLLNRAGVRKCTVHTLRHTFATRCVENGMDVKSLSEIMGHSDVQTTMRRYVHPSMETKKAEINKLPCPVLSGQKSGQKET